MPLFFGDIKFQYINPGKHHKPWVTASTAEKYIKDDYCLEVLHDAYMHGWLHK